MKRVLFVFLFLCSGLIARENYYIDPVNGHDTNYDGKSQSTPWKTIKAINDHSGFGAGDSILLLRGKTYAVSSNTSDLQLVNAYALHEHPRHSLYAAIYPKGNGTAIEPIVLGAYGSGTKPIIHIEENYNNIALGGVVLRNQDHFIIQDLRIEYTPTSRTVDPITGSVTYTDPANYRWGILVRCDSILPLRTYEGIKIRNNEIYNVYGSFTKESYHGIYHEPSMYEVGGIHFYIEEEDNSTIANNRMNNVLIEGNYVENTTGTGIYFRGQDKNFRSTTMNWNNLSTNVVVKNNHVKNSLDGIIVAGVDNVLIERNIVDGAGVTGKNYNDQDVIDSVNRIYSGTDERIFNQLRGRYSTRALCAIWPTFFRNGIIQYNEVMNTKKCPGDGQALHTDVGASGRIIFQYNYTHNNEGAGFCETWADRGLDDLVNVPNTIVRYNISYNDGGASDPIYMNLGGTEFYNNVIINQDDIVFHHADPTNHPPYTSVNNIRNNIFITSNLLDNTNTQINNIFNNNSYFNPFPPAGTTGEMPELGYLLSNRPADANAILLNPLFVNGLTFNSADDFKLLKGSPLIGAGLEISNNGGRDFWGTPLYSKETPEVGAYEERVDITPAINLLLD